MQTKIPIAVLAIVSGLFASAAFPRAQQPNPTQRLPEEQVPVFRVTVVARTVPALNYRHRGGATSIDFRGTPLLPESRGEAKVESKQGYIEIEVEFDDLSPATQFGPEYLTYVMWAITPEGRSTNLGEVLLNDKSSKLNVTTELQAFGLVVTAEPYFAVTQPSDVVVMENVLRSDTRAKVEQVEARYELLKRGTYLMNTDAKRLPARKLDRDTPLELYEARNAVNLARIAGADEYAPETFQKASQLVAQAEDDQRRDRGRRTIIMASREAAQTAEDARLITLERREEERVARETQAALDREAEATARARVEADRRQAAEADRLAAERRRADAEEAAQRAARERADAEGARLAAERARTDAQLATARLEQERAAAEAARLQADADLADARRLAAQAEREKAELRDRLRRQLNIILETKETARGLIVNMSDVLFDTARDTLRPGAREKLSKVAGILLAYPDLNIEVEGHTDSVGSDDYNQDLSERRAQSVRSYLVGQGIPNRSIIAEGFGEARPVATNSTAEGRQQNRRVELVVSGESIATPTTDSDLAGPPLARR